MHGSTQKIKNRYFEVIKPLIWKYNTSRKIANKCKKDISVISNSVKRFGNIEDKNKLKENNKIILIEANKKKTVFGDNLKRIEKCKKRYFEVIKPLIWKNFTSIDINKKLNLKDRNRVRTDTKRFGSKCDYEKLIKNGIQKKRKTIIQLMKNKTSKPEKMLFDIVKIFYPSAKHRYKFLSDKGFYWELDVAIPELKINFEYDGKYWHNKNRNRDKNRDLFLIKNGWKVIRFEYKENPKYEKILEDFKLKDVFHSI